MKRNRFRTLILSLLLFAGLCGCTHAPATESEVPQQSTEPASGNSRFDAAAYKADIEALREIWDQPGQDAPVQAQIEEMLRAVDTAYADYARAEIAYYSDWNNEERCQKRSAAYEDLYIVSDMTNWALANG